MKPKELTERTLGLHKLIAQKIKQDPGLLSVVEANIEHYKRIASPRSRHYYEAWGEHFKKGFDHFLSLATEESEEADDLRQCSPFTGILSNKERWEYLKKWRAEREASGS